jgi:hypothetical protein
VLVVVAPGSVVEPGGGLAPGSVGAVEVEGASPTTVVVVVTGIVVALEKVVLVEEVLSVEEVLVGEVAAGRALVVAAFVDPAALAPAAWPIPAPTTTVRSPTADAALRHERNREEGARGILGYRVSGPASLAPRPTEGIQLTWP